MTFARTLCGELVALDPALTDGFASRLGGRVLVESAAEYEQARRVWNGLIDKRPAAIVRCSGVADVLESLRFARVRRDAGELGAGTSAGSAEAAVAYAARDVGRIARRSARPAAGPRSSQPQPDDARLPDRHCP